MTNAPVNMNMERERQQFLTLQRNLEPDSTLQSLLTGAKRLGLNSNYIRRAISHLPASILEKPRREFPDSSTYSDVVLSDLGYSSRYYFIPTLWNVIVDHVKEFQSKTPSTPAVTLDLRKGIVAPKKTAKAVTPQRGSVFGVRKRRLFHTPSSTAPVAAKFKPLQSRGIVRAARPLDTQTTPKRGSITAVQKKVLFPREDVEPDESDVFFTPRTSPEQSVVRRVVSVPRRHRRILLSNGLTNGDVRRLARRGGVKRISKLVRADVNEALRSFLTEAIKKTVVITTYANRRTVSVTDVLMALKSIGRTIYL